MRRIKLTRDAIEEIQTLAMFGEPIGGRTVYLDSYETYHGEGVDWAYGCPNEVCCPCCGCDCDWEDDEDAED